ncbi:MAG: hypothetical protein V1702_01965 [Candidatus Woesearchaeota archaeon]
MELNLEKMLNTGKRLACTSLLVGTLIVGSACAKPAPIAQPVSVPSQISQLQGYTSVDEIINKTEEGTLISMYGNPRADIVAMYILVLKNSYGRDLHDVSADLYLLNREWGDYDILSYKFAGDVPKNASMQPFWTLKKASKLVPDLKDSMTVGVNINDTPLEMIFINSKEGVFQANLSKSYVLLWNGAEMVKYDRTAGPGLYDLFKGANVPVPERK